MAGVGGRAGLLGSPSSERLAGLGHRTPGFSAPFEGGGAWQTPDMGQVDTQCPKTAVMRVQHPLQG